MSVLLRIVGLIWIFLSAKDVLSLAQRLLGSGLNTHFGLNDLLAIVMLAGGIGLLMLKEWGRWILLTGVIAAFLLNVGPALLRLNLGPLFLRHSIFYGIFIVLLLIPQARGATEK